MSVRAGIRTQDYMCHSQHLYSQSYIYPYLFYYETINQQSLTLFLLRFRYIYLFTQLNSKLSQYINQVNK